MRDRAALWQLGASRNDCPGKFELYSRRILQFRVGIADKRAEPFRPCLAIGEHGAIDFAHGWQRGGELANLSG